MDKIGLGGDLRDRLMEDLQLIVKDAEDLLRSTGQQVDEGYRTARARFESTLSNARSNLGDLEERVAEGTRDAIDATQQYVKENPWQAVGIGAAAGLVIGLLIGRR
ncbi:DUF883 family protein [Noviherbaspirillum denitrificans]|uniref:DUF883 domain-containing protein n=1 Tax=Noviherbaspirillum denitrificans TaxID=1968433 RepID=A0A254TC51_9BURK|nr:DUF883 family protein [Noviherbaspirillum denitrificans]OWW20236.1 hypothetical protein AYR66_12755 [Noviherbaspirillum denitrificans]